MFYVGTYGSGVVCENGEGRKGPSVRGSTFGWRNHLGLEFLGARKLVLAEDSFFARVVMLPAVLHAAGDTLGRSGAGLAK